MHLRFSMKNESTHFTQRDAAETSSHLLDVWIPSQLHAAIQEIAHGAVPEDACFHGSTDPNQQVFLHNDRFTVSLTRDLRRQLLLQAWKAALLTPGESATSC